MDALAGVDTGRSHRFLHLTRAVRIFIFPARKGTLFPSSVSKSFFSVHAAFCPIIPLEACFNLFLLVRENPGSI